MPRKCSADEVLPRSPRLHSELQLRSAEIILFPSLCTQDQLGDLVGWSASQTQLPKKHPQFQEGYSSHGFLEPTDLALNPNFTNYWLWNLQQLSLPMKASISSPVKWGNWWDDIEWLLTKCQTWNALYISNLFNNPMKQDLISILHEDTEAERSWLI